MSGAFDGIRLSPHVYNTLDEVDRTVGALAAYV
jgi:selenocysteine lyase/cysteine desulfurase